MTFEDLKSLFRFCIQFFIRKHFNDFNCIVKSFKFIQDFSIDIPRCLSSKKTAVVASARKEKIAHRHSYFWLMWRVDEFWNIFINIVAPQFSLLWIQSTFLKDSTHRVAKLNVSHSHSYKLSVIIEICSKTTRHFHYVLDDRW